MSLYSFNEYPKEHGRTYKDFIARSQRIVEDSVNKMKQSVDREEELTELFLSLIESMAQSRRDLAIFHRLKGSEQYGQRRDANDYRYITNITLFRGKSAFYEKRVTEGIQKDLMPIKRTLQKFNQTSLETHSPICCGREFKTQYEIFNEDHKPHFLYIDSEADYEAACRVLEINPIPAFTEERFTTLSQNKRNMVQLKVKAPELYKRLKLQPCYVKMQKKFPEVRKSDWILGTQRITLDTQQIALSQFLTWTYRNFKHDPVLKIKEISATLILRQDRFLIPLMLQKISRVFKQALQCHPYELAQIKEHAALMKYLFIHAMPYAKGTSSISEWLEQSVYRFHGYTITYNPKQMPSYEALTLSWNDFFNSYDTMYSFTSDIQAMD